MANFPLLREPQPLPKALTDEQITALLSVFNPKTFQGLRNLAFISLLLDTGLRLSEALNLDVADLNFTTGLIFVRHSKSRRERMVPMSPSLMRVLQKYLLHRAMRAQQHVTALWITRFGTPLRSIRCVQEIFQRAAKKAGIKTKVSPHVLRFTFVRKWLQSGGDSIVLQRILGHTTPIMTAYYARLFWDRFGRGSPTALTAGKSSGWFASSENLTMLMALEPRSGFRAETFAARHLPSLSAPLVAFCFPTV